MKSSQLHFYIPEGFQEPVYKFQNILVTIAGFGVYGSFEKENYQNVLFIWQRK